VVLETKLKGSNEVSSTIGSRAVVGDRDGTGKAFVFGIDNDVSTLCYVLKVKRIGPAAAAHIHEGQRGTNGPVVVNLAAPADGNAADCLTEGEDSKFDIEDRIREAKLGAGLRHLPSGRPA